MDFGVCYYPEHWPENRWPTDARLMRSLGIEYVRIGEFAWSLMETADSRYDWGWLDRAIDILAAAGLKVILGTPTATPPAWLTRQHPDILRMDSNGGYRDHGTRRHVCPTSPTYRIYSSRIVQAMGERYGQDPRIAGWQIDNELGGGKTGRCYCPNCTAAFQAWLRRRYKSLDALNQAWGASFWSQTYTAWEQITPPHDGINYKNPSQMLDFYRFSSDRLVGYQQEQLDLLRRLAPGRFITHNFMGLFLDVEQFDLAAPLDFVSWDAYPTGFPDRHRHWLYPLDWDAGRNRPVYAYDVGEPEVIQFAHDLMRGLKQRPFWVMEQQAGHINWGDINPGVRPGTPRLWTWQALAAGADTVVYFRWRASTISHEQYHSGLLRHDATPDVGFGDLERLRDEKEVLDLLTAEPPAPQVGLLFDYDSLWALQVNPHRKDFNYLRQLFIYYHTLQRLGIPVDLVSPRRGDLGRYRLLLAGSAHVVDEPQAAALTRYVEQGGHLLLGVRSGFKTGSSLVTDDPLPGRLRHLAGVTIADWRSLPAGISLPLETAIPDLDPEAGYWVESLIPLPDAGTAILASYAPQDDPAAGKAALTRSATGRGQTTYLGWYPTPRQARALLAHLAGELDIERLGELPDGVLAARRGPYAIYLNTTDRPQTVHAFGEEIPVRPRDVAVFNRPRPA